MSTLEQTTNGVSASFRASTLNEKGQVMEVVQLKRFKRALKFQQTVAVHDLRENREIIAVDGSADEFDQAERSAEREFAGSWSQSKIGPTSQHSGSIAPY